MSSPIVGATKPKQIRDNVKANRLVLDGVVMKRIDEVLAQVVERAPKKTVSPAKWP